MAHLQTLSYNSFPPHRHVSAPKPISAATALDHIQSYLNRAQDAAYLHPDASFNENGPQFARHASEGGLILQLLRRVEKGLKGERIIADLPGEDAMAIVGLPFGEIGNEQDFPAGDETGFGQASEPTKKSDGLDAAEQAALESGSFVGKTYNEQMIDDGEDGITDGEIGPRTNFVRDLTGTSSSNKRKFSQVADSRTLSKEERKRAKKERQLMERRRQQDENELRNRAEKAGKDHDVEEFAVLGPSEDRDDVVDELKPGDAATDNGTSFKDAVTADTVEAKAEKKAQRRAQKQAKKRAQHELSGGDSGNYNNGRDESMKIPEGGDKVEVVGQLGQEEMVTTRDMMEKKNKMNKKKKK